MTLKSENYAKEFQIYAGAFKCGGAESLIPEEVESKREGKNAEKLKSKIKKDRWKWKEAANKKPEVGKHSFRSGRLEVIWVRERTSHATETREKRGSSLSPRVSSLRGRSFLRSYYFIAPTICRLSKTENTCDQKNDWLWDQNDNSLPYACAEVLTWTKNYPWSPQSHPQSSSTHEVSVENVATTARGYGCARTWDTRLARVWEACKRLV